MSRALPRPRAHALASLVALAAVGLGGATVVTAPAQSAAPAGDCATAFPIDQLAAGDAVTGLTVTHGTTPEGFTGEVLGVLHDGIGPGTDMVMVRLSSPEIDRVGIWEGMSGSPVYAADGRLIGAVAYGLAMGGSTVAGVTPFSAMQDHLAETPKTVRVDGATARTIARRADVGVAAASGGFQQLAMPVGVAGVGAARLAAAERHAAGHRWLPRSTYAVGRASADAATADSIVAGGNLAASLSYGDVTMAAVGTATSVCGDRVLGFGHPVEWRGATTLGLNPADAIYIQDDLVAGFKVANLGEPVGTITQDRGTGIAGTLGSLPATTEVSVTINRDGHSRTGVSHVALRTPDALATTTFYGLAADLQAVVDGPVTGSDEQSWTVSGTDADGAPFELSSSNLFSSKHDLTWRVGYEVGDLVYRLAHVPGITIDSISLTSDLAEAVPTYHVTGLQARQHGVWVPVGRRSPLLAHAGGTLAARVVLAGGGQQHTVPVRLQVPDRLAGKVAFLAVLGGDSLGRSRPPRSVAKLGAWLDRLVRNDELEVSLVGGGGGGGSHVVFLGRTAAQLRTGAVLGPVDGVVKGHAFAPVLVK